MSKRFHANPATWATFPCERNRSAIPRWSRTSIVRECRPPAREPARSWLARRSTMATSTPANASSPASISPVGPPPAITTAGSLIAPPFGIGRPRPAITALGREYCKTSPDRGEAAGGHADIASSHHGDVSAHRESRADRRSADGGAGVDRRHARLVLRAAFRLAECVRLTARSGARRPLQHSARDDRLRLATALPAGHRDPHHPVHDAGRGR